MFAFNTSAGELLRGATKEQATRIASGYSGNGDGKNNPSMESVKNVGPMPRGWYTMEVIENENGHPIDYEHKKAPVIRFIPDATNEMFGRSGFLMHGDSIQEPGTASEGCNIEDHTTRLFVASCIRAGENRFLVF